MNQINVKQLYNNLDEYFVLDVRNYTEYENGHIPNAVNIHAGYLSDRLNELSKDDKIVVHCAGGDRSSIAASILLR